METGFVELIDKSWGATGNCETQEPKLDIYTAVAWLHLLSVNAKKQFLPFKPTPSDTLRALTVITHGCVNGTAAGPVCDSITRVVVLADDSGSKVVEAAENYPLTQAWQNGFGASTSCSALVSKFSQSDVQKTRNSKGEFLIAVFSGSTRLKTYTIKQKYIKQLGL
jgi:poly(3-hydroxybutyrate) depolymerase